MKNNHSSKAELGKFMNGTYNARIQKNKLHVLMRLILILAGTLLIINGFVMAFLSNFNVGIMMTLSVGGLLLFYGVLFARVNHVSRRGLFKWVRRFIFLGLAFMGCLIVFLAVYGHTDSVTYKEDALIVLGAGIRGERVTIPLANRLLKAVEYYEKNPDTVIIVSGGQGPQEHITEALAMERYLVSKGIPQNKIIKEEKSTSTYENFIYSKPILEEHFKRDYSTAFITNNFHIYRANELSKIAGFESTRLHAGIQWYTYPNHYLRECAAVLKLWVLRK